jgi:hypothetical protein
MTTEVVHLLQPAEPQPATQREPQARRIWETGLLVQLSVDMWTGTSALSPEDLGLPAVPEMYNLGRKLLVPKHLLRPIHAAAQRAYRTVERWAVPFPAGNARFAPITALPRLTSELDSIRADFDAAADRFVLAYTEVWHTVMSKAYEHAARVAFQVARSTGAVPEGRTEDEFVQDYLERIRRAYPSPQAVRARFSLSYQIYQITAPETAQILSSSAHHDYDTLRAIAEQARQAYREHVEAFLQEAVVELRARVAEACREAAETISRNQTVTEHTLQSLRRMVEDFRLLNFVGDAQVEVLLRDLSNRYLSGPARVLRETNAIPALRQALDTIAAAARDQSGISQVTGRLKRQIILDA